MRLAALLCLAVSGVAGGEELLPPETPAAEAIDHYIDARLREAGVQPAAVARDELLVRRTTLDLAGRPATVDEVRGYLAASEEGRRQQLIERLIQSDEFSRHQAAELDRLLMGGRGSLGDYLQAAVQENRAWDAIFRELLLAETKETAQFLKSRVSDLDKLATEASVVFFGVNISCAQCHDHPEVPDWSQQRFYGMKSFFSRTFDNGDFVAERDYGVVEFKTTEGESHKASLMFFTGQEVDEPETKEPDDKAKKEQKKRFDEFKKKKQRAPAPKFSRRAKLVEVALAKENRPYLARAIVNQMWKRFYGRGLVHPADQLHPENEPSHPQLLDWLARDLIAHQFDLRRLAQSLVSSNAYARSSRWSDSGPRPDDDLFAVAAVRPLTPQQYGAALKLGSTDPEFYAPDKDEERRKRIEQLHSSARGLAGKFEAPRDDFQISVTEALLMSNNESIEKDLLRSSKGSLVHRLLQLETPEQRAETAIWTVFGYAPDADEVKPLAEYLQQREERPEDGIRQVVWALLCSGQNRFNY